MIRPHELEEYLPGPRSAPRRPEGGPYLCGYAYGRQDAPSGARRDGPLGRVGRARGGRDECGDGRRPPGAGGGVRTPRRCGGRARRDVPSRSPPLRGERPQSGPLVPWASGLPRPVGAPGEGAPAGPLADNRVSNCRSKGTRGGRPPASGRRRPPLPRAPSNAPSITIGHHRGPATRSALLAVRHRVLLDRDRPRCAEAARDRVAMAEGAQGAPGAQNRSQAGIRPIPAKGDSGPSSPRTVTTSILPKTTGDFRSMVTTCRD